MKACRLPKRILRRNGGNGGGGGMRCNRNQYKGYLKDNAKKGHVERDESWKFCGIICLFQWWTYKSNG